MPVIVKLILGPDSATEVLFCTALGLEADTEAYMYLESITDLRDAVSAPGVSTVGAGETPSVTVGLYNRENELFDLVGILRRTPLQVLVDGVLIFSGLVTKQTLGATMYLDATA